MRSRIHVLIVDDSALIRQMLARALRADPRIEVVGMAGNGVDALEKARSLNPDVITLDIEMTELDGLEVLRRLPRYSSARVVMLSSYADPETIYQALSLGAVDFIPKPGPGVVRSDLSDAVARQLGRAVRVAFRARPVLRDRAQAPGSAADDDGTIEMGSQSWGAEADGSGSTAASVQKVVTIASSIGGPPALERVMGGLDGSWPVAYVIVQHLPEGFAPSLARRLSSAGTIPVEVACDGLVLESAKAYLAPHGVHTCIERDGSTARLRFDSARPALHGVRPSADPLFESAAAAFGDCCVGVVLTGMGSDGSAGLLAIRKAGGTTIAQDEKTSVVWGMPGTAVRRNAVQRVVPIGLVATEIRRSLKARS